MHWFIKQIGFKLAELLLDKIQAAVIAIYKDQIVNNARDEINELQQKRSVLIKSISRAATNDERKILSTMLADLSRMPNN